MKTKSYILPLLFLMALTTIVSCSRGIGDVRDENLEHAILSRLDSVPGIQYVGMSGTHEVDGDRFQAVIIYYVTDSDGNRTEYNSRVTANKDCSEIYTWEDMDSHVLGDVKQKVSDKMKEKGFDINGSLIDALIELKKR